MKTQDMKVLPIGYIIPEWAMSPLVNGDNSALDDNEIKQLEEFCHKVADEYGNANFMPGDFDDPNANLGFMHTNDIDWLGDNCYTLYIIPSNLGCQE